MKKLENCIALIKTQFEGVNFTMSLIFFYLIYHRKEQACTLRLLFPESIASGIIDEKNCQNSRIEIVWIKNT